MAQKDYYELLGVSKGATEQELKAAYKKKVMQFHPDRFATKPEAERKQAEETFKEINHAYDVLSDADKRANYDRFGSEDGMGASGFGGNYGGGFNSSNFSDIFGDIFGNMFGGGGTTRANAPMDGDDITVRLNLTFEEAVFGCDKEIKITRVEKCSDCKGTGAADPKSVQTCPHCHGSGFVTMTQQTIFGVSQVRSQCRECGGTGKIIKDKCKKCRGKGVVNVERTIPITVPAGANTGQTMTIYNEGHAGINGGSNGKLYILINVAEHSLFKREGNDLYLEVPITILEATLGGKITVPTLNKPISYTIPAGTQSGDMFRLKGYGVKHLKRDVYGDMYVTVNVETPVKLAKNQEELLKSFYNSLDEKSHPEKKTFSSKYLTKK